MDEINVEIELPVDEQGFCDVKCNNCGENFKLYPNDINDDRVLFLYCPACGLQISNFLSEGAFELAQIKLHNKANEFIYNQLKDIEKNFKNSLFSFDAGKKPDAIYERHLTSNIDSFEKIKYLCCKKEAKIKPLLKFTGSYCPFCGVKYDEIE